MNSMESSNAPAADEMPPEEMDGGAENPTIMLDKSNPDVADALGDCEPGEMLKVVRNDESEIVLEKVGYGDESTPAPKRPEPGEGTPEDEDLPTPGKMSTGNPAVDKIMAKRGKM